MFNASLNIGMTSETDGVRMVEFWTTNDTEQGRLRLHCRALNGGAFRRIAAVSGIVRVRETAFCRPLKRAWGSWETLARPTAEAVGYGPHLRSRLCSTAVLGSAALSLMTFVQIDEGDSPDSQK
jgi:hypothetical protein